MPDPVLRDIPTRIATARLHLRPPQAGDGRIMYEAVVDALPQLRKFLASVPWAAHEPSEESSEIYCHHAQANFLARTDFPYLIFDSASNQLVGCTGLHRFHWAVPKFEVGFWCRTSQTGKGFISEAVAALAGVAEKNFSGARIELITDESNHRARSVAIRCGFVLEGILRDERRSPDGTLRNSCLYARTKSEPTRVNLQG